MIGSKNYDKSLTATDNELLNYLTLGAVNHNFHHSYPWDVNGSEYGWKSNFNVHALFIEFFASIGWAYDLKLVPKIIIDRRKRKTGHINQSRNYVKNNPILDWIFGFIASGAIVWIAFPIRILYCYIIF
jgi:hypothetical protein